jgi:ABC-type sugar transport system ATPase subunit
VLFRSPLSYFVADFFGNPAMNLIEGEFRQNGAGAEFHSDSLTLPLPEKFKNTPPGKGTFGIRPENVKVSRENSGDIRKIGLVEPLGKDTLLYFETTAERPFVAIVEGTESYTAGEPVELSFPGDNMFLFDSNGDRIR